MIKYIYFFIFCFVFCFSYGQSNINGTLGNDSGEVVMFANIVLYDGEDNMIKVESSDENGGFMFRNIKNGSFYILSSFIGYENYKSDIFEVGSEDIDLGQISMLVSAIELETAVVKAKRTLVEVKADRMVFNVEGTINSVGDNALGLLRKAPGVMIDNNNNVTVLSRSGVMIYIDGKRLPLSGDDLTAYLESLPSDQIDRMDIITNPGAKYEAQGNAGIIDIRLKRNKSHGANGSISGSLSQGQFFSGNISSVGNFRNKAVNVFATLGYNNRTSFNNMHFLNFQNNLITNEDIFSNFNSKGVNFRFGTDFFVGKHQTIGFWTISKETGYFRKSNRNL